MEEKETQEKSATPEKKRSPMMLIIVLIIAALIIGGGGTVAFFMLKGKAKQPAEKTAAKEPAKTHTMGPVHMLEPFIVNLSGTGKNYLKVEIGLELGDAKDTAEIENKLPQIKDAILLLLTSKSFDAVQTSEGKVTLKQEIITRLNTFLAGGTIKNVYFTNFVVQ